MHDEARDDSEMAKGDEAERSDDIEVVEGDEDVTDYASRWESSIDEVGAGDWEDHMGGPDDYELENPEDFEDLDDREHELFEDEDLEDEDLEGEDSEDGEDDSREDHRVWARACGQLQAELPPGVANHALHLKLHREQLRRRSFPLPPEVDLLRRQRSFVARYGYWLEALIAGRLNPLTPAQAEFVRVCSAGVGARTFAERAWLRFKQGGARTSAGAQVDTESLFTSLALCRREILEREFVKQREAEAAMASVRPTLEAIERKHAEWLEPKLAELRKLEGSVKSAIVARGHSHRAQGVQAIYYRAHYRWKTRELDEYASTRPELNEFRAEVPPRVSIRYSIRLPDKDQPPLA